MLSPAEVAFALKQFKSLIRQGKLILGKGKTEKQLANEFKEILLGKEPSTYTDDLLNEAGKVLPFDHSGLRALKNAAVANKNFKHKKSAKKPAAKKVTKKPAAKKVTRR